MVFWGDGLPGGVIDGVPGGWGDGLPIIVEGSGVSSVTMLSCELIRVVFSEEMKHVSEENSNDSLNPNNYSATGPTDFIVNDVTLYQANPTIVDLEVDTTSVDGWTNGGAYTLNVANVETLGGEVITKTTGSFTGVNCQANSFIAEILIGNEVVWSAINQFPQQNLLLNVHKFVGVQQLKFRIRGLA